jgi:hypothetical protein
MPCRYPRLSALMTRPCFAHTFFSCPSLHLSACVRIHLPVLFTLHHSRLQGHILPSRGPCHPRLAPLVLQVLVSQHVIDWSEGLGVLGFTHTPLSRVFMPLFFTLYLFLSYHFLHTSPPLFSLLPPCPTLFLFPNSSPSAPHLGLDFVLALDLDLVLCLVFLRSCCHTQRRL